MLDDQLMALIQEGNIISTKIKEQIGQLTLFSLGKLAAYFMLDDDDWEAIQNVDGFIRSLNLPSSIQGIYISYVDWNRKCGNFFHKCRWKSDERIKGFSRLRKDFGKEINRREPRLQLLYATITEQVSILQSLLSEPPKIGRKPTKEKIPRTKIQKKGWSTRKIAYTCIYMMFCIVVDSLLFPIIGWSVIPLIAVQVAIMLGFPKLVEWLRE